MPWSTPTLREVRSLVRDAIHAIASRRRTPTCRTASCAFSPTARGRCVTSRCNMSIGWRCNCCPTRRRRSGSTVTEKSGWSMPTARPGESWRRWRTARSPFTGDRRDASCRSAHSVQSAPGAIAFETTDEIDPRFQRDADSRHGPGARSRHRRKPAGRHPSLDDANRSSASIRRPPWSRLDGGTDEETDEELRARVLRRIRQPPMGGDAYDYVAWALAVPGVTRAWCSPLEMGIGTVTVRFMMDDLRADNDGFPIADDIAVGRRLSRQRSARWR